MNAPGSVQRDERTVAVENASYRWGLILLTYALLIDVAYRGLVRQEAAWDLLALVIASAGACTAYQARERILARGWAKAGLLIALLGGVVAAVLAVVLTIAQAR